MDNLSIVKAVDKFIKGIFIYTEDVGDSWDSKFNEIINAEISHNIDYRFKGDCEDLAFSCIEYAHYKGIDINDMARVIVDSYPDGTDSPPEGHMVGLFIDRTTNKVYYFGDTFGDVCEVSQRDHKPRLVNYFNDNIDWVEYNDFKFK